MMFNLILHDRQMQQLYIPPQTNTNNAIEFIPQKDDQDKVKNVKYNSPVFYLAMVLYILVFINFLFFAEIPDPNKVARKLIQDKPPLNTTLYKEYFVDDSCLKLMDKYLEEQYVILAGMNQMPEKDEKRYNFVKNRIDELSKYKELHPDLAKNMTNYFDADFETSINEAKFHRYVVFFKIMLLLVFAMVVSCCSGAWYFDQKNKEQAQQMDTYALFVFLLTMISCLYYGVECFLPISNTGDYLLRAECPLKEIRCFGDCVPNIEYILER